jgi:5'-3' exonuclease
MCWDRRREIIYNGDGVQGKYGVAPASIPDWLALVGDSADGFPGIPGWGEKSAATVLARFAHLEAIPKDPLTWGLGGRAAKLSDALRAQWDNAVLFRTLAMLRNDVPLKINLADLEWRGARPGLRALGSTLGADKFVERIERWQA